MSIGATFRKFRKMKNFSLKETSENIVTISFLSKFERDFTDISISRFLLLLERIGISIEEFMYIYNKPEENFFEMLNFYFQSNDIESLNLLEESEKKENSKIKELKIITIHTFKGKLTGECVSENEINILRNYLMKINDWSLFEILLYGNNLSLFDADSVLILTKTLLKKAIIYENIRKDNVSNIVLILNNTILFCVENERLKDGFELLAMLNSFIASDKDFYSKYKYLNLKGILFYSAGERTTGIDLLRKSINILKVLEKNLMIKHEYNYLSSILKYEDLKKIF